MRKSIRNLFIYLLVVLPTFLIAQPPGNGNGNGKGGGNGGGPGGGNGNDPCLKPKPPASCVPIDDGIIWLGLAGGVLGFYYFRKNKTTDKASSTL